MFTRLILFTSFIFAFAANLSLGVMIESGPQSLEQTEAPQVLRDNQGTLTLDEVMESATWRNISHRKDIYPGFDHAAFWLKSRYTSTSTALELWLITLESTRWEEIDWYIVRASGEVEHHAAGNARAGRPGVMASLLPNIILSLAPEETVEVFLRCRSRARGSLVIEITSLENAPGRGVENIYLLAFGALGVACILGLLIALRGREKGGVFYSLSIAPTVLFYVGLSGFAKSAEWPFVHFLTMRGGNFFIELAMLLALFYIRAFFDLKQATGWPVLVWRALFITSLVALPLSLFVPYEPSIRFINLHGSIHGFASVFIAVWAWRQGMGFAKFYVIAWPCFWLALTLDFLADEGLLHLPVSQDHLVVIGLVIFQFGVFLVLAERNRAKIREYEEAQDRLLEKERTLTSDLELQVTSRTASLQQATTEAIKANQFKDLFLANIGHEIRTPLSALIGLSQFMVRKGEAANLSEDFRRLLRQIHSGGSHLNLMLTNLMDVGTANQGKIPLILGSIDLAAWSHSVRDILDPLAAARGLTLDWTESFDASDVFNCDQIRLSQILINLVHNALKFSPDCGTVYISIQKVGDALSLEILDQGPGLPDHPERLFTAFARHDSTLSDAEHGAGLGLHIVQTNLDLLHGKIQPSNRPSGGASFIVTIPESSL